MKRIIFLVSLVIIPLLSFSQEIAWSLIVDRKTDTKLYDKHDITSQNNQLVLDFSELARNRKPIKIDLIEDVIPNSSFSFFATIKASKNSIQNSVIVSNKSSESDDGWEIRANELGGWEWNFTLDGKVVSRYKTISPNHLINDDKLHMIGFTYDYRKNQVWLYFDDVQLGVLNIKKGDLSKFKNIYIGGVGENEVTAFDGYFKSLYLFKSILNLNNVKQVYRNKSNVNKSKFEGTVGVNGHFYSRIRVLTWNVSDGGVSQGNVVGLKRTLKVLKDSKADIIALQEPKESLEYLADGLGYYFYSVSSDVAILSKFPILRTITFFKEEKLGGLEIQISKKQKLYFFDFNLDNEADWSDFSNKYTNEEFRNRELETRGKDAGEILEQIDVILKPSKRTSIILAGQFNSMSPLDENGIYNDFPVADTINHYGYIDSYREYYPKTRVYKGYTRNVDSKDKRKGRVDYIFYRGNKIMVNWTSVIKKHPIKFPSENYGVLTEFIWKN